jgi:ADP-L-glycero-D-manno-heptose 6-epimerase
MKTLIKKYTDANLWNKKILITGGAGFIGSNLALYFQKNHPEAEIIVFDIFRSDDKFSNGNLKFFGDYRNLLDFRGEIISGDINSKKDLELIRELRADYIFHESAISDTTVKDQKLMIDTNVVAFKNILEIARENNSRVIYASSGATYGDSKSPQTVGIEEPKNIYGFSKLMMDQIALKYIKKYYMNIVGLRYFNVYGKNEFFKGKTSSMVLQFALQILSGSAPKLFEGSDKIFRDFIYIEDILQANILSMFSKSGIYNVGTGKARSFQDIADILQKELKRDLGNIYIKNPFIEQYQFYTEANILNTQNILGYRPQYSLETGIADYVPEILKIFNNYGNKI